MPPARNTSMSDEQRAAVERARRLLAPHFAGEEVRLYVPREAAERKIERERRIRLSLEAGLSTAAIARAEDVSDRYVRALRGRIGRGAGTLPP